MSFTKALANMLMSTNGIRTNCVNPGPIWTVCVGLLSLQIKSAADVLEFTRPGQPVKTSSRASQPIIPVSFNEGLVSGFGVGQTPINRCAAVHDEL